MRTRIFLPLIGIGLLALSGCTTVNTVENADKQGQRQMVTDQRAITDASLGRKVSIVGVNQSMTPGGLLKVQVELQNRTRSLQRFSYNFEWFDANGMQINNITSALITVCRLTTSPPRSFRTRSRARKASSFPVLRRIRTAKISASNSLKLIKL
jgi:uncharacterized protein YcfL